MTSITLTGLTKRFGTTTAVDRVDLTIDPGDLFFLLGPSGCGKTTLLRMIAGFLEPTAGRIRFGDRDVTDLAPNRRNTGMVFQSYALWPHMTVADNVAYGLAVRKVPAPTRTERVMAALRTVRMEPLARRKPNQLSGGQQQRVALARALVIEPTVLLLDEPLSNLDAKLRLEMRSEIRRICSQTGITTVYVTHDQKEALSMADRVAVLQEGRVMQIGPPRRLYDRPASRFVADFLGETNFIGASVTACGEDGIALKTAAGVLRSSVSGPDLNVGDRVTCSVRPETLCFADGATGANQLTGEHVQSIYLGEVAQHVVRLPDGSTLKVLQMNPGLLPSPGSRVAMSVDENHVIVLRD
jgi:iron(III) transport system ATP-binding protein